MTEFFTPQIAEKVYYVGVKDRDRRLFDSLIPLPQGTTYNAYLIKDIKTALIDTVNPGFEKELETRINQIQPVTNIDYIIMNHAEPDHAGAIPYLLEKNSKAKLVTTKRGAEAAKIYFKTPEKRIQIVKDGDTLKLGSKTLRFIEAPMLHWPETMFTYLEEDKILFPCDFLGLHTAYGFYDEEVPELIPYAQRYFGEIMMPYRSMGKRGLDKIRDLEIEVIAPSHGPIHRNPGRILDAYRRWTSGETLDKVILVYATMWKSTEKMIMHLAETLEKEGIEAPVYNLATADIGDIAKDLVDSKGIVLGTPTVLGRMHPLAVYAAHLVRVLKPPAMFGVVLTSYGWGKGALDHASEMLGPTGLELVGAVEVNGAPSNEDYDEINQIGVTLAKKIKGS
ncbi:MAG TPA: FprA family A-type flavoprotein [Candidatus Bathyarchaeota archaeon]|nr:FprA family A-type flavoprotein [Candidatus Bathyarchaeota archaeon]